MRHDISTIEDRLRTQPFRYLPKSLRNSFVDSFSYITELNCEALGMNKKQSVLVFNNMLLDESNADFITTELPYRNSFYDICATICSKYPALPDLPNLPVIIEHARTDEYVTYDLVGFNLSATSPYRAQHYRAFAKANFGKYRVSNTPTEYKLVPAALCKRFKIEASDLLFATLMGNITPKDSIF